MKRSVSLKVLYLIWYKVGKTNIFQYILSEALSNTSVKPHCIDQLKCDRRTGVRSITLKECVKGCECRLPGAWIVECPSASLPMAAHLETLSPSGMTLCSVTTGRKLSTNCSRRITSLVSLHQCYTIVSYLLEITHWYLTNYKDTSKPYYTRKMP